MRAETQGHIEKIRKSLELLGQRMGLETAQHRLEEFNARVEDPDLWNDPERAQKLMRERQSLVDQIGTYEAIKTGLFRQFRTDRAGRDGGRRGGRGRGRGGAGRLVEMAAAKELEALLDGEADANDTFLEINAGAGGTESCDWAGMLARMYTRWAEKARLRGGAAIGQLRRGGGDQVRRLQDLGAQRLWLAEIGIGRASPGADQPL
jgi:peptide chain release factor 2